MKQNARRGILAAFFLMGAAFLVMLSLLSASADAAIEEPGGIVENAAPGIWALRDNKKVILEDGDSVYEFDILQTDESGSGSIRFNDDSILEMGSSSEVDLRLLIFSSARARLNIGILQGAARFISGGIVKINPRFLKLTTPKSAIGIRGTTLLVEENPDSEVITGEDLDQGHYIIVTNNNTFQVCSITGNGGSVSTDGGDTMTVSGPAQNGVTYQSVIAIRSSHLASIGRNSGGDRNEREGDDGCCRDSSNTVSGHRDKSN
ncbi:MAG: FecR family protein [Synergistaceae bacterium]|jgi:hypothetical protein|nr:FecR family protein [Synergistaceae bacterium]